jgi:hypothetical protein
MEEKAPKNDNNLLVTPTNVDATNDTKLTPSTPLDKEWGLDSIVLSVPVVEEDQDFPDCEWDFIDGRIYEGADESRYVSNLTHENGNIRVSYKPIRKEMYISFNAARIVSAKSIELLPPSALKPLLERLFTVLVGQIPLRPAFVSINKGEIRLKDGWEKQVSFIRLDCARNFIVEQPEAIKHALSKQRGKYHKTTHMYFNKDGWTLVNASKTQGVDRIYDKSAELKSLEQEERFEWNRKWFRFEAQLMKQRLKKYGLKTLDKIDNQRVWDAIEGRWKKCEWNVSLPGEGSLSDLSQQLPIKKRIEFFGYMAACTHGFLDVADEGTVKRCKKHAKALKVTPGLPLELYGPMNMTLSLWHGEVVPQDEANRRV